jgi:sulfate adenylyltransferase subunit 2
VKISTQGTWLTTAAVAEHEGKSEKQVHRDLLKFLGSAPVSDFDALQGSNGEQVDSFQLQLLLDWVARKRKKIIYMQWFSNTRTLVLTDRRGHSKWVNLPGNSIIESVLEEAVREGDVILPHGNVLDIIPQGSATVASSTVTTIFERGPFKPAASGIAPPKLSAHLRELERQSIEIFRIAASAASKPAMLFSMGKDSMVLLRLAEKAFAPEPIPFPILGIDTRWKFRQMYSFREWLENRGDIDYSIFVNPEAISRGINPFDHGSALHTDITKTQALKLLLDDGQFDFVFGGARRDEEKSRAKERIFSIRDELHRWDPKEQRPELWNSFNTFLAAGQSARVFPLSNWTEKDIWEYVEAENIPLVPLYFSALRPVVNRNGSLIMVDDERMQLEEGEVVDFQQVRFRTLGCYPLTGAFESQATSVSEISEELGESKLSERSSRVIDRDAGASMEQKKKEGYF